MRRQRFDKTAPTSRCGSDSEQGVEIDENVDDFVRVLLYDDVDDDRTDDDTDSHFDARGEERQEFGQRQK